MHSPHQRASSVHWVRSFGRRAERTRAPGCAGALRWWGWCFGLDISGQRGRPRLAAEGFPAWMPAVHTHAVTLAARPKVELQEAVRQSIRLRMHTEALTQLRASEMGPSSYDLVLQLLVASGVHFGELRRSIARIFLRSAPRISKLTRKKLILQPSITLHRRLHIHRGCPFRVASRLSDSSACLVFSYAFLILPSRQ